ncbi:MAG: hypothetical protein J5871_00105 [Bacteroidales bacterium]|nr:hypothetical protein [Bacteroidales bacterium]
MDIDLLSRMVRELILRQDSVGLPGIGTFVAEQAPASFSDRGYTINPPYRRLNFRQGPSEDKSLVALYAASNAGQLTPERAEAILLQYLLELKEVLKVRKTVVFPGLGRLRATRENRFFFVADQDLDIFPEGYGLAPLSLKFHESTPLAPKLNDGPPAEKLEKTPQPVPDKTTAPEAQEQAAPLSPPGKRFRWWIPLLVLLGLCLVAFAAFLVVARVYPDLTDPLLYTPEELRIIHY